MRRLLLLLACPAALAAQEPYDHAMIAKIRDEGLNHSHAWAMLDSLATVIGPRLTASPAFHRSIDFAVAHLHGWGLSDVHVEHWPFGRGWQLEGFTLEMTAPRYAPMIGYPDAWSPSTNGDVVGTPILIAGISADSLEKMRGRLKGAIVMTQSMMTNFVREDRINPTAPNAPPDVYKPAAAIGGRGGRGRGAGGCACR